MQATRRTWRFTIFYNTAFEIIYWHAMYDIYVMVNHIIHPRPFHEIFNSITDNL